MLESDENNHLEYELMIRLLFLLLTLNLCFAQESDTREVNVQSVVEIRITSSINPATLNYLKDTFEKAKKENAGLILIKMNTPGGLVTTTKDILTEFGESDIPVAVWITPEGASATSAGAIISSGSHFLFMSRGTNIGAATPIQMGKDIQKDMRSKAINDLVALTKGLSESRGRNAEAFGLMISEAKSYSAKEAEEKKIINSIINKEADLWKFLNDKVTQLKGEKVKLKVSENPKVLVFEMDPGQKLLNMFANPNMAYILFIIGAALIYLELQAPGGFIAGAIGAVCLILAAIGFQILPINFGALALIVLSFLLFVLEVYITSYGILSLAGVAALIFGSLFLYRSDNSYLELKNSVIFSTVGAVVIYLGLLFFFFLKDFKNRPMGAQNRIVGKQGKVEQILSEDEGFYQVFINGEHWKTVCDEALNIGDKVEAIDEDGLTLRVKKLS